MYRMNNKGLNQVLDPVLFPYRSKKCSGTNTTAQAETETVSRLFSRQTRAAPVRKARQALPGGGLPCVYSSEKYVSFRMLARMYSPQEYSERNSPSNRSRRPMLRSCQA